MSIVNLGLQSMGVMQIEMPPEAEKALKNCNSLKQIRSAGDKFRKEIAESVKAPIDLLSDIMRRLELNGKKFEENRALMLNWNLFGRSCSKSNLHFLRMTSCETRSGTRLHYRSFFPLLPATALHLLYQEVWERRVQSVQASENGKRRVSIS